MAIKRGKHEHAQQGNKEGKTKMTNEQQIAKLQKEVADLKQAIKATETALLKKQIAEIKTELIQARAKFQTIQL